MKSILPKTLEGPGNRDIVLLAYEHSRDNHLSTDSGLSAGLPRLSISAGDYREPVMITVAMYRVRFAQCPKVPEALVPFLFVGSEFLRPRPTKLMRDHECRGIFSHIYVT